MLEYNSQFLLLFLQQVFLFVLEPEVAPLLDGPLLGLRRIFGIHSVVQFLTLAQTRIVVLIANHGWLEVALLQLLFVICSLFLAAELLLLLLDALLPLVVSGENAMVLVPNQGALVEHIRRQA